MTVITAGRDEVRDITILVEARKAARSGRGRELRRQVGLSQTEMGSFCGVTATAISLWESGKRTPRGAAAYRYGQLIQLLERRARSDETED